MRMNSSLLVGGIALLGGSLWMAVRRRRVNTSFPTLRNYFRAFGKWVARMTGKRMIRRLWAN